MPKITGSVTKYPARMSLLCYLMFMVLGAILLYQPFCHRPGSEPISAINSLFTATSAVCVTGLTVVSTQNDFSMWGQLVILVMAQVGGIGIMTITTFVLFRLGRRQTLRQRAVVTEIAGSDEISDLRRILWSVIVMTFVLEAAGALMLWISLVPAMPAGEALWSAIFHSVSAFCNAGFSLYDDSLTRFQRNHLLLLTVSALIIIGGLGFPVMLDVRNSLYAARGSRWTRLHLHSKIMLVGTAALLLLGFVVILWLEWNGVLKDRPLAQKFLLAFFHSVTPRTAGFNAVNMGTLSNATLFFTMLLMFVGGGAGSTAGGYKVSTLVILCLRAWSTFRGFSRVNVFRRTIPREVIERALVTVMLFAGVATLGLTLLLIIEQSSQPREDAQGLFLDAAFEVVSALGTVGLSTGLTENLTSYGKWIVICLMLMGRLGPISIFVAVSGSQRKEAFEYPSEEPLIG